MPNALLFPCDPLNPRRPDPHFAREAAAARELGFAVAYVDHDAALRGDAAEAVARVPEGFGALFYRGWMLPVAAYEAMDAALRRRGAFPVSSPRAYRVGHELPSWYPYFRQHSPASRTIPLADGERPTATRLADEAVELPPGPGVVKDWVKSRKHEWDTACFVPDLADTVRLESVVAAFLDGQAEFLTGGVVIRAYENLTGPEVRVWWLDGEPVLATPHPDAREDADAVAPQDVPLSNELRASVRDLDAPFVTTDLALRADGVWRVVEVGDGQVSDLPASVDAADLLRPLLGDRPAVRVREFDGRLHDDPSDVVLFDLLADVTTYHNFLVVERVDTDPPEQFYIQVYLNEDLTLSVEYRDGGADRHFEATLERWGDFAVHDLAAKVLADWTADRPGWRDALPWQPLSDY
ncbi:ATP-grasp domain-containing protein [Yinghuangia seranimata]|uniref:ATP-grasp domain-containing protein n=1 Tax=Yinghuangia seranimata TaxID=408067 RepID=UPI0031BAEAB7